jgi:type I restriction enzyme, S subunit
MGKYRGYEEYKESGAEWIGSIPKHWHVKRLRYMGTCQNGVSNGADYFGSGYPFVNYTDVYANSELPKVVIGLAKSTDSDRINYSVKAGDVFFTRTSETIEEIGIASTCFNSIDNAIFSGFLIRFRPFINLLFQSFSKYYFRSQLHRLFFVKEMNLVTRASLSQELLKRLPVLVPPLDEQELIAHFLDRKTSQIDALIAKKEALLEKLDEKRTALISHAVTKGLDPNVPMKDSGVEWLGEIPAHWTVLKLGRLCDVTKLTGFEYTKTWRTDPIGEIIALRGFNIKNNQLILNDVERITSELSNKLSRSKLHSGDIVFPCTGTLGEGAIIDEDDRYHINQNIAKISPTHDVGRKFLLFYLCSKNMKYQIDLHNTSGVQPVLLIGTIRSLMIAIPNHNEQNIIAEYLKKKTAEIDKQKAKVKEAIALLKEYRTALITNAVTGKIDVRQVSSP